MPSHSLDLHTSGKTTVLLYQVSWQPDFCMAVTLENTFNAWYDINNISDKQISFRNLCDILSESLYLESLGIEDKVEEDDIDDNDSANDNIANNGIVVVEESDDDDES